MDKNIKALGVLIASGAAIIFFVFLGVVLSTPNNTPVPNDPVLKENSQTEMMKNSPSTTVVAQGIKRPHGIGYHKGVIYVSSETDKTLYKVIDGKVEKFVVNVDFPHDMIFDEFGSIVTPLFHENRVVRISPEGEVIEIAKGFSGPNGIAMDDFGTLYVSNYNSGVISLIGKNSLFVSNLVTGLKGPAGIRWNNDSDSIDFVTYLDNGIHNYSLKDKKINQRFLSDITHIESINREGNKIFTGVKGGKGVVFGDEGSVLVETDLPEPIVGYFVGDSEVYLVSPNDTQGRVLKVKLKR